MLKKRHIYRTAIYLAGLATASAGTVTAVQSQLGASPITSMANSISLVSGVRLGTCTIFIFAVFIMIQIVLQYPKIKFLWLSFQLLSSFIFGLYVNFFKSLLTNFIPQSYIGQLAAMAVSIVMMSFGLVVFMSADIAPMPPEGMIMVIAEKLGLAFHNVKITVDCLGVSLACLITFVGLGAVTGIREGTVISAFMIGKCFALFSKYLKPAIDRLCFKEKPENRTAVNPI